MDNDGTEERSQEETGMGGEQLGKRRRKDGQVGGAVRESRRENFISDKPWESATSSEEESSGEEDSSSEETKGTTREVRIPELRFLLQCECAMCLHFLSKSVNRSG